MSDKLPPDHPAADAVMAALDECDRCDALVKAASAKLRAAVQALSTIDARPSRLQAVRWLYWSEPRVRVSDLVSALFDGVNGRRSANVLRKLVGPNGLVKCSHADCDELAPVTSRMAHPVCAAHEKRSNPRTPEQLAKEDEYRAVAAAARADVDREIQELTARAGLDGDDLERLYALIAHQIDFRGFYR